MLRVMIVEDEDMIRKGLVFTIDWLSMDCVVVAEASNGQEGYERILEYKPDVVIADICMPFMDGIEMIQKASEYYMKLDRSENGYVSKLLEAIRTRYGEKLSIESISEEMGVSASYLSRKFKEITGQTFLDFLNKYRVQQAITLLNTKEYRISEISEAVGFSDYKHFCSVFKKYTLKSPTKFVKGG